MSRVAERAERGFTVIEISIATMLSMIVMSAILGVLVSQSNAERRVSTFADNQEILREAMVQMQRDIRSSEPLKPLGTSEEYMLRVDLNVYEDIDAPTPTAVRWRVDTATKELVREEVNAAGTVVAVSHRVPGVRNTAANPLFVYYSQAVTPYDLSGSVPADIAQCTMRIHINLVAAPRPGPEPATLASDAQLRNRLPGGQGCDNSGAVL